MLVLSRKVEEGVRLGETIEIKILNVYSTDQSNSRTSKVASIGIEAPKEISILRKELKETVRENLSAQQSVRDLSSDALVNILKKKRRLIAGDSSETKLN